MSTNAKTILNHPSSPTLESMVLDYPSQTDVTCQCFAHSEELSWVQHRPRCLLADCSGRDGFCCILGLFQNVRDAKHHPLFVSSPLVNDVRSG